MSMINPFTGDAFSTTSLTAAVNKRPYVPSKLRTMGLFAPKSVATTSVVVEEKNGQLGLIQTGIRGERAPTKGNSKRKARSFIVPHLKQERIVRADEVQGVRQFGSENSLETVQSVINGKMDEALSDLDATTEHHMLGAVSGLLLDADGSVIYNLFNEFQVTQHTEVDFNLDAAAAGIRSNTAAIRRLMKSELGVQGSLPFNIEAFCDADFFDALINHHEVKAAYDRYQEGAALREDFTHGVFPYAGVLWHDYQGMDDGSSGIGDQKVQFFPSGIPDLFTVTFAPADYLETANTLGLPRYAAMPPELQTIRSATLEVQSNPLCLCTRPRVLIKGKRT
ncbi:MAG: major capsid protein [Niveispirillum sp.]|uniref:major capsid protein n=1 Tax=Niveispirillum sp. TaxID=1917217 RepID=UPI004035D202